MHNRKIICLTPVKNEAWILETFLKCTSVWADHIIIADQGSTDESVEIARQFNKVILVENKSKEYNEEARQQLLLSEARKIQGDNNILFALDADEILVNFHNEPQWKNLHTAPAGSVIFIPSLNVLPGIDTYYLASPRILYGGIDSGREHKGKLIHSYRVPHEEGDNEIVFSGAQLLHFQYASRERLLSKHRWYECIERVKFRDKNNIDIYRFYHHIDLPQSNFQAVNKKWLQPFDEQGISIKNIKDNGLYWWDKEVCILFEKHGIEKFKKQAIWYINWAAVYKSYFPGKELGEIKDPRTVFDKWVHNWLAASQAQPFKLYNKIVNRFLRLIHW